jgi:hypothetical protein
MEIFKESTKKPMGAIDINKVIGGDISRISEIAS